MFVDEWGELKQQSLSLRRAWIEIASHTTAQSATEVALLTESVD